MKDNPAGIHRRGLLWKMKGILVLPPLILLFICASAWCQTSGNIRGVVKDEDQQAIAGVTVVIESTALIGRTRTAYTNKLGVFRFPSVPIGTYTVEATLPGYETVRAPCWIPAIHLCRIPG